MTIENLKSSIQKIVDDYPIKRVSLLTLSMIKVKLEEMLNVGVDIIHGPLKETDLIEVGKVVELYAA